MKILLKGMKRSQHGFLINFKWLKSYLEYCKKTPIQHPRTKWSVFCELCLKESFTVYLDPAWTTVSKYITVINKDKTKKFKVRFSNHKPNYIKETMSKDCNFYVGKTHTGVRTYSDAFRNLLKYMKEEE